MKARHQRNKEKDHLAQVKKHHRKEFFANLKKVCNLLAGYDLYSKFPVAFLEKIYKQRLYQVGMGFDDEIIPRTELKELGEYLHALITIHSVDLPHGKGTVDLGLLLIEGHSLTFLANTLKDDDFPAARETREVLKPYVEYDYDISFNQKVQQMLFIHGLMVSEVDHGFIWVIFKMQPTKKKTSFHYSFEFDKVVPVKETFIIEDHARPAYRVGWAFPYTGMVWAEIKPAQKGITHEEPMPVFIQAHALVRLKERMELPSGMMHYFLYESIKNLNYHFDKKGKVLIDYISHQKKTGYLVASVENNRLLIHTFLFLTNNGTPEGKRLSELTGLQPMDKKYLAIDKFSTFISYKIKDNEFVKNIFVQAGCGHLLDIEDSARVFFDPAKQISADVIASYLMAHMANH